MSIEVKSQAIEHPIADRINNSNPVNNSDLELNLTLRAPKRSEEAALLSVQVALWQNWKS